MNLLEGRLVTETGDLTQKMAGAVVNAANSSLMGGGGVDGAIHSAGGPEILDACREIRRTRFPGGLPAGEAVITTAGRLPADYVIHTVGPVWHGGLQGEPELLAKAYRSCLSLAAGYGLKTIAFPAVSTGIYGYPGELAARTVYETVASFLGGHSLPETVYLVFYNPRSEKVFLESCR
jgi:O-acetyl-ADP-ribose deacetylase (regulator of RNase III)